MHKFGYVFRTLGGVARLYIYFLYNLSSGQLCEYMCYTYLCLHNTEVYRLSAKIVDYFIEFLWFVSVTLFQFFLKILFIPSLIARLSVSAHVHP